MKNLRIIFILLISLSLFQSCTKEDIAEDTQRVAPELPAPESFIMSFEGYEQADTSNLPQTNTGGNLNPTYRNWFYSATNVVVWNVVLTVNLVVPVASFHEAFKHQAVFQGDGVWLWSYNFTDDFGQTFRARLFGEIVSNDAIQWDMYISKVGGFTDVHWYSGLTSENGNKANWTLNHQPNNPETFLQIDYEKNSTGLEVIRYTNIIPNNVNNGDFIEHRKGIGAAENFDRAYDIFKMEKDNLLEINWDATNKNGRVKDAMKFGDEEWHCWNQFLQDTDC